jgi:formylglycine-generating enzyme required for sulfatase activity
MFDKAIVKSLVVAVLVLAANTAMADTFGTGANTFTIDFVPISSATNPSGGYGIVYYSYRMGTYEITNDQWNKFKAAYGTMTGNPSRAYDSSSSYTGTNVPTDNVSWYEAAQFVNWLNTSTGHQAAYKFTGAQGTTNYTFAPWSSGDPGYVASNPYRNANAFYFLPSENEWVKAAYWNGTALQTYATKDNGFPAQGNGTSGTGWNYWNNGPATNPEGPWAVGSGSQELNGTYDMMGNDFEWMESPMNSGDYGAGSSRALRSGHWYYDSYVMASSTRSIYYPAEECDIVGFRVASVPEPGSIALMLAGALCLLAYAWQRRMRLS